MITTTNYIYDGFQYLGEADENGVVTKRYINRPDSYTNLIGQHDVTSGENRYYHYDAIGSTRSVTDENENVTDTFTYDAWGNVLSRTGMSDIPFQYVGEHGYYHDVETENFYIIHRIYMPAIIRWLSNDPLHFTIVGDTKTAYTYTANTPIMSIDPSGMIRIKPPFDDEPLVSPKPEEDCPPLRAPKPCDEFGSTISDPGIDSYFDCSYIAGGLIRLPLIKFPPPIPGEDKCSQTIITGIFKTTGIILGPKGKDCADARLPAGLLVSGTFDCRRFTSCKTLLGIGFKCCRPPGGRQPSIRDYPPIPIFSPITPTPHMPAMPLPGIPIPVPSPNKPNCIYYYFTKFRIIAALHEEGKCKEKCCSDDDERKPF